MIKSLLVIVVTAALYSCNQANKSVTKKGNVEAVSSEKNTQNDKDIFTKYEYFDSEEKSITIENGFPRGGIKYIDPKGNESSYAVFWTRFINQTDNPLQLEIDLPINSYEISNFPGKNFKILVPNYNITHDKIPLINQTDLKSFIDDNSNKPALFKRTINPKESSGFYFVMLISTLQATGMTRTELKLKGQELFYKISRYSNTKPATIIDEKEIHCGSINMKNLKLL